ncbi:unnamed protein product [Medioppia subpectinata]|uniref:Cytochrome P450 n=1 Tax=Medioppia subpectinata TaxID=1979941 RepID=A0A7R9LC99_9ACAR|nr:unnamed protein product [Medioppia subpectinata]CAG2117281.1 unnamed protein product [Medioppia subpectinata]
MLFLIAGNETTATLLSFLLYELSVNENCQQRLYEEIRGVEGDYSYESIARMPYLEACVAETLRHYPPNPAITRICTKEYVLGNTGLTIPKGMTVNFDVYGIHHSPEYYPNPERWDPERFLPSNRDQLVPYTYLPFGLGPRNCVGMRFALMQAKTTVAQLIDKYRFKRTANTRYPPTFEMFEFVLTSDDINIAKYKLINSIMLANMKRYFKIKKSTKNDAKSINSVEKVFDLEELVIKIFSYLEIHELIGLERVSKQFQFCANYWFRQQKTVSFNDNYCGIYHFMPDIDVIHNSYAFPLRYLQTNANQNPCLMENKHKMIWLSKKLPNIEYL